MPAPAGVGGCLMSGEHRVGFKNPPRHTRFQKGRSGNPRGRPKGTRNLRSDLQDELEERISVSQGGTKRVVSKQRAMIKSLLARALQGDSRAAGRILDLVVRILPQDEPEPPHQELGRDDAAILRTYEERLVRRIKRGRK